MELRDLGILPGALASFATAVNDSAEVVGYSSVPLRPGSSRSNETHPFRWTKSGGMVELSLPVNASYGEATGVNNAGEISGWVVYVTSTGQSARPVRWRPDGTVEALAIPSGDVDGVASAINDDGDIVGYGDDGYYYFAAVHALVWHRGGGVTIVDACGQECIVDGHSISGNGRVAGIRLDHAFVWTQAGGVVDFPSLPGASYSEARGVNDTGQLAINNFYPAGPRASIAFGPGKFQDLGIVRGKSYTTAAAINNAGAIVGFAQ